MFMTIAGPGAVLALEILSSVVSGIPFMVVLAILSMVASVSADHSSVVLDIVVSVLATLMVMQEDFIIEGSTTIEILALIDQEGGMSIIAWREPRSEEDLI